MRKGGHGDPPLQTLPPDDGSPREGIWATRPSPWGCPVSHAPASLFPSHGVPTADRGGDEPVVNWRNRLHSGPVAVYCLQHPQPRQRGGNNATTAPGDRNDGARCKALPGNHIGLFKVFKVPGTFVSRCLAPWSFQGAWHLGLPWSALAFQGAWHLGLFPGVPHLLPRPPDGGPSGR